MDNAGNGGFRAPYAAAAQMYAEPMHQRPASPTGATYTGEQYLRGEQATAQPGVAQSEYSSMPTPAMLASQAFQGRAYADVGSNMHHAPTYGPPPAFESSLTHNRGQYLAMNTTGSSMAPPNASHDRSYPYGQTAHRTSSADPEANDAAWMFFGRIGRHAQAQKYGYGCDYCPKVHTRPQDLWRHLEHIHGHEVIPCVYPGCKEVFPKARKDYMLRHLQASHGVQRE